MNKIFNPYIFAISLILADGFDRLTSLSPAWISSKLKLYEEESFQYIGLSILEKIYKILNVDSWTLIEFIKPIDGFKDSIHLLNALIQYGIFPYIVLTILLIVFTSRIVLISGISAFLFFSRDVLERDTLLVLGVVSFIIILVLILSFPSNKTKTPQL